MGDGAELSLITEEQAWPMFDAMTGASILLPSVVDAFDECVAEIIMEKKEEIKDMIRAEFESKGWIKI